MKIFHSYGFFWGGIHLFNAHLISSPALHLGLSEPKRCVTRQRPTGSRDRTSPRSAKCEADFWRVWWLSFRKEKCDFPVRYVNLPHSYWKCWFIVDLPIQKGDFPDVPIFIHCTWLVVIIPTPLKKIRVRQLGWWNSQLNGKIKHVPNHQPDQNMGGSLLLYQQ